MMTYDELDDTDRKILRILQDDSTLTVKELAARVNLSASPTFDRQKRLEREGFIKGYHAILDAKRTGNGITVLCNMRLKQHSQLLMDDFMEAIQGIEEITECYNTSGEYDFTLKIQTRDMDSYQEFMRTKLGNIDEVMVDHQITGSIEAHVEHVAFFHINLCIFLIGLGRLGQAACQTHVRVHRRRHEEEDEQDEGNIGSRTGIQSRHLFLLSCHSMI